MKVSISAGAQADLLAISEYIARDNPQRSRSYIDELLEQVARIPDQPRAYRLRREWGQRVRAARHGPYLILFEVVALEVVILRIIHGKRDIGAALREER